MKARAIAALLAVVFLLTHTAIARAEKPFAYVMGVDLVICFGAEPNEFLAYS